jgi:putative flippase GtrA
MSARLRRLGDEGARFAAVNVAATLVALTLFNLLTHGIHGIFSGPLNDRPLSSYVLSNTIGMLISFYGSRSYVFRHRRPAGPGGGFVNYAIVNLASFSIPVACLWFSRNVLEWESIVADNVAGNVVGALLGTVFRFWAFRRFVFKRPTHLWPGHDETGRHAPGMHVWMGSVDPELVPGMTELVEHQAQQRDADAHDVVRVPGDAGDEGTADAVQREGARDGQRLAGGDVGGDLLLGDRREPDLRRR